MLISHTALERAWSPHSTKTLGDHSSKSGVTGAEHATATEETEAVASVGCRAGRAAAHSAVEQAQQGPYTTSPAPDRARVALGRVTQNRQ